MLRVFLSRTARSSLSNTDLHINSIKDGIFISMEMPFFIIMPDLRNIKPDLSSTRRSFMKTKQWYTKDKATVYQEYSNAALLVPKCFLNLVLHFAGIMPHFTNRIFVACVRVKDPTLTLSLTQETLSYSECYSTLVRV